MTTNLEIGIARINKEKKLAIFIQLTDNDEPDCSLAYGIIDAKHALEISNKLADFVKKLKTMQEEEK